MPIGPVVDGATIVLFCGLLIGAAVSDARRFLIPNTFSFAIILLYPIHAYAVFRSANGAEALNWIGSILLAVTIFAVGTGLFAAGVLGGGDVKLLAGAALWAGPDGSPLLLIITAIGGAVISLAMMWRFRRRKGLEAGQPSQDAEQGPLKIEIPYGVAISFGGIIIGGQLFGNMVAGWSA